MKYILDTDILVWILRGNKEFIKAIIKITKGKKQAISLISVAEIFKNIFPSEIKPTEKFLKAHHQLSLNYEVSKKAGLYWKEYIKTKRKISLLDCFIAATAKLNNLKVITCNTKHFPMKDIKVINPLKIKI